MGQTPKVHISGFASTGMTVNVSRTLFGLFTTTLKGFPIPSSTISVTWGKIQIRKQKKKYQEMTSTNLQRILLPP